MPLPPGLLLNPQTGELTGVPTVPGTYAIELKVRDLLGSERTLVDEVVINAYTPMSWSGNLGNLMATRAMTGNTVTRSGGLAPYTYSIFSGTLPDGLSLNTGTGAITGTPTTPGGYAFTLRVVDQLGQIKDYLLAGTIAVNLTASFSGEERGTVSVPYSQSVTVNGGTTPYTYSLASGALPNGIVFADGVLNGTPTAAGTPSAVLRITDAHGFIADTAAIDFDIAAYPTISGGVPRGMVGKAYSSSALVAAGGHIPYAWAAFGLPPGLSINSGTGAVTGTPTTPGNYEVEFSFTDVLLVQATKEQFIEIAPALSIGGAYSASVTRNIVYPTFQPVVSGGYMPRAFAISAGALPPGLTLDSGTGAISGTPTTQGSYSATLRVTDADGSTATMAFNVDVAGDMAITGSVPNRGTTTVAFTGDNLGRTGGTPPVTWSVQSGALPTGLSLNTLSGDITGTPTTPGTYNFTIRATDASGGWAQSAFTTAVAAYPSLTGTLPDASNGLAYNEGFAAAGGHAPLVWDISVGALPTGLSINANDGRITGTPSANGTFNFTVRITDDAGNVATRAGTITVYAAPSLSTTLDSPSEEGLAYSDGLSVSGGKTPVTWSVEGTLPPGLTINSGTGVISGTINTGIITTGANRVYAFTVRVQDALGRAATSSQSIDVKRRVRHVTGAPPPPYFTRTVSVNTVVDAEFGLTAYSFAVIGGALPTGVSMNSAGSITGTPTVNGTFNFTVRVTDALGATADAAYSVTVVDPVVISGTPGNGTVGVAYAFQPSVSGGITGYQWFHVAGTLPPGCTLNGDTGRVSGTPTTAGAWDYTLRVFSGGSLSQDDHAVTTTIAAFPTLTLNYPRGMVGKAYSGTVTTANGHTPKSYARIAGAFPTGLTLNSSTGALTGTPTAVGLFTGTVRMTDALGNIVDRAFSIQIVAALTISSTFAAPAWQGVAYDSTVGASGGYAPYSWSLISGTIPAGTTRSNSRIFGTPTTVAVYNFTLRVTDADGSTFDKAFAIEVNASSFSLSASPNPASAYAFSSGLNVTVSTASTVTPTGGNPPFSYSWSRISVAGSAGDFTVSGQNTNRLAVSRTGSADYLRTETWRCTVTDSAAIVRTINVQFELEIENGGGGGGGGCVDYDAVLPDGRFVRDLKPGDKVMCIDVTNDDDRGFEADVVSIHFDTQPCHTLITATGVELHPQSLSTRMTTHDGREVESKDFIGEEVLLRSRDGRVLMWDRVVAARDEGVRTVINLYLGNRMYFVACKGGEWAAATHNAKQD